MDLRRSPHPGPGLVLASLAPREAYGRAFGLERAGDNLGAVVGRLLVARLGIRPAISFALVPGLFAAITITVAAREARRRGPATRSSGRRLDLPLAVVAAAPGAFVLAGSGIGLVGGIQPAGDFASSAVVGLLYAVVSPTVGFAYAGGWMLLSVVASGAVSGRRSTAPA